MSILGKLVGTPQAAPGDTGTEVVKAKEFDITQYGKKVGLFVGAFVPVLVAALKALGVEEVTDAMVIAALGVTAVALFSVSLVMGVDMIARAIVTKAGEEGEDGSGGGDVSSVQTGLEVRLEDSTDMRPVLAIRGDGAGNSFLVKFALAMRDRGLPPGHP